MNTIAYRALGGGSLKMTDNLRETSGWIRKYLFSKPHTFVLEDLCWNLVTKVLEDQPFVSCLKICGWNLQYLFLNLIIFVLEDLCLNLHAKVLEYYLFVLEDSWLNPSTFVAESWDIRGRSLSGWIRYVLEPEFVLYTHTYIYTHLYGYRIHNF